MRPVPPRAEPAGYVKPPPARFNFADHLLETNAARAAKVAYIDDAGQLTYGALADRVRQFAAALRGLGLRRDERVLLLMLDSSDWPVVFLGSLYAGCRPGRRQHAAQRGRLGLHARAQPRAGRVRVGAAPSHPAIRDGAERGTSCDRSSFRVVNRRRAPSTWSSCSRDAEPFARRSARTGADEPAFWLYSSGSTGRAERHGAPAREPHADRRALRASRSSGIREADLVFSAAKLFFAYGLGNALTFPLSVGATTRADGRAADAGRGLQAAADEHQPDHLLRRADAVRRACSPSPTLPARDDSRCASASRRARRCPRHRRALDARTSASTSSTASARRRCCTSSSPTGPATCATARPASRCPATRCELVDDHGKPIAAGRGRRAARSAGRRRR